jgi:hypothetical protein
MFEPQKLPFGEWSKWIFQDFDLKYNGNCLRKQNCVERRKTLFVKKTRYVSTIREEMRVLTLTNRELGRNASQIIWLRKRIVNDDLSVKHPW